MRHHRKCLREARGTVPDEGLGGRGRYWLATGDEAATPSACRAAVVVVARLFVPARLYTSTVDGAAGFGRAVPSHWAIT